MFDLSSKFNTFYENHVKLSATEKSILRQYKKLNLERLKSGLVEYNIEKKTGYKIIGTVEQGSVAMGTVSQNDTNDYDIDVAIIFEKDNLPNGTIATKNIIVDALKRKCKQFKKEPEAKTNCVRIEYVDGYHVDFAIYRRYKNPQDEYIYEHCGSEWRPRDPRAITQWFMNKNKENDFNLRRVVRLSKMFCKSRCWWNMPGGLIQSVLAEESVKQNSKVDLLFYETIKGVRDRLNYNKEIYNPVDATTSLLFKETDRDKVKNLYNRLDVYISKLDVLFQEDCTQIEAVEAWKAFFEHAFWENLLSESRTVNKSLASFADSSVYRYDDTEESIEQYHPVNLMYNLRINCKVTQDGWMTRLLTEMLNIREPLRINKKLDFHIVNIDVPKPYKIYWKVKNQGDVAKKKNCVRGQILKGDESGHKSEETTFKGEHYVECYIIKDDICVAMDRIDVPISSL